MQPGSPAVVEALAWWSSYYGDHQALSVGIRFLHLAGVVVGGGTALAADRDVVAAFRAGSEARAVALARLAGVHRIVVPALALMAITGAAMAAADTETFLNSRLYWTKMALVGALILNGAALVAAERRAGRGAARGWIALATTSALSVLLWLATLLAGTWLTVAA